MTKLITFLDAATPYVQAFDVVLMLACGVYCIASVRRKRSAGMLLLAVSCFVSALILFGFFLSATVDNQPLLPLTAQAREIAYLLARLLAPFELLLFAIAIILVARRNRSLD